MTEAADNVSAESQPAHHLESHQNEAQRNGYEKLSTEPAACILEQRCQRKTATAPAAVKQRQHTANRHRDENIRT